MPRSRTIIPADRFFARIDKFECECPACGQLLFSDRDEDTLPRRLNTRARKRSAARERPRNRSVWRLLFNPRTQRLHCPWCNVNYIVGLLAFPVLPGSRRVLEPPPDTLPTKRQRLEMRQLTGGFWAKQTYKRGDEVNVVVDHGCLCEGKGWAPHCPIHGDPLHGGGQLAGE